MGVQKSSFDRRLGCADDTPQITSEAMLCFLNARCGTLCYMYHLPNILKFDWYPCMHIMISQNTNSEKWKTFIALISPFILLSLAFQAMSYPKAINSSRPSDAYIRLWIIGSDNGLSPVLHQAIIWTSDGLLVIGSLGTNLCGILIKINFYTQDEFKHTVWKMATILSRC